MYMIIYIDICNIMIITDELKNNLFYSSYSSSHTQSALVAANPFISLAPPSSTLSTYR